jgi:hypothetical protein
MAGVAGPMLRRSKAQGARFLGGLMFGEFVSSALVATMLYILGTLVSLVAPLPVREVATAIVVMALGVADLRNRTPHIWRQVPQQFVRSLPPGRLGLVWGFDLALLFTTQKSTSLTWVVLAATGLLYPADSWFVLLSMTTIGVLTITVRSVYWCLRPLAVKGDMASRWFRAMRRTVGASQVALAGVILIGAWS